MELFLLRRAVERLRAGLSDPVAVDRLTIEEEPLTNSFSKGLQAQEMGRSGHLCICGSYGQGKSHSLTYLQRKALSCGYATSLCQLDVREVPFYQFSTVYRSLMKNLSLPTGESFVEAWKKCALNVPDEMPNRFRVILQAMAKNDNHYLEQALLGHNLPAADLKRILKTKVQSLTLRKNAPYIQTVHSLGKLLNGMGYKGLVLFFDEAESIAAMRLSSRVKSYEILNQFFQHSGFVYPVFAFTDSFFDKVRSEEYGGETSKFPENYAEAWEDLQIVRLQDFSSAHSEALQDRLINLYAEAYQINFSDKYLEIKQQMRALLEKLNSQEMRLKLKALINQLDVISVRAAS